jgi:hypothetical protein
VLCRRTLQSTASEVAAFETVSPCRRKERLTEQYDAIWMEAALAEQLGAVGPGQRPLDALTYQPRIRL